MEETKAPTQEQIDAGKKVIKQSIEFMYNWLKDGSFLLEERNDLIRGYEALEFLVSGKEADHEKNKEVLNGLAWVHYKLGVTPIKRKNLDEAQMARGVLFTFCTDLQQKIEQVEPPAPKAPAEPKKPYIMEVPMNGASQ